MAEHHEDGVCDNLPPIAVALLTPIIKAYCTERGFQNVSDCRCGLATMIVHRAQMRDSRTMIYEGTNFIQALDLIGRKLPEGTVVSI